MLAIRRRGSPANLVAGIVVVVLIAGFTDTLLRTLGWNQPPHEMWPDFAPRGGVIGAIWVGLFACMGTARWLVTRSGTAAGARNAAFITGLIALCLAYPFYTHVIAGHRIELAGNVVSLAFALIVATRIWSNSRLAALLIALVAAWIVFATALVFALARLNGW